MITKDSYLPGGSKRKFFTLKNTTIKVLKIAQTEGGYSRGGDVLDDLVCKDAKRRCKAQKAILKARKSL